MLVQMDLARVVISELNDHQVIFLQERDGERSLPILIGIFEAKSIDRRIKRQFTKRPLTHDLVAQTIQALGGRLDSVVIDNVEQQTYFAKLRIEQDGNLVSVDARPSDAIAIAVSQSPMLSIFVTEEVLASAPDADE